MDCWVKSKFWVFSFFWSNSNFHSNFKLDFRARSERALTMEHEHLGRAVGSRKGPALEIAMVAHNLFSSTKRDKITRNQ